MPENPPQDFGAHLRQAREARGTSLKQIAEATKISVHALEALERNDISRLPGGIFTRAFVRAYAKEVGLDPDRTLAAFAARFPDESPVAADGARSDATGWHEAGGDRSGHGPLNVVGLLISVGLLVVFFLVFGRLFSRQSPNSPPGRSAARQSAEPTHPPGAEERGGGATRPAKPPKAGAEAARPVAPQAVPPPPGGVPLPTPGTSAPQPLPSATPTPAPPPASPPARPEGTTQPAEGGTAAGTAGLSVNTAGEPANARLTMEITATGSCWISATLDGGRTVARLLAPGERAVLRAADAIVIRVGDAGSFTYTLNGAAGRPLGGRGQVVDERIDASNFQAYQAR